MLFASSFDIATSLGGFLNNAAVQERWRGWGWGEGKGGEIISSAMRAVAGGRGGSQQTSEFSGFMILHEWTAGSWETQLSLEWEGASWESGCFWSFCEWFFFFNMALLLWMALGANCCKILLRLYTGSSRDVGVGVRCSKTQMWQY